MNDDRVEWHLWNWATWQQSNIGGIDLDYRGRASAGTNYNSTDDHGKGYEKMCFWWAEAIDAIVESDLPPAQRGAVMNKHLHCCYAVRDEPAQYRAAFEAIRRGLTMRSIV